MDKIYVNGMAFYGYHGVYPEENRLGQRYFVDVVFELDLQPAGTTDDLSQTVNYADAYNLTKDIVEGPTRKLVESVAENLAQSFLEAFPIIHGCSVKITKPDPPIPGHYDGVAVEITRMRHNE